MTKKIAITGGIGSGKSAMLRCVRELGFSAFSCDEIYHELLTQEDYVQKIAEIFPSFVQNGQIDRKALGAFVFEKESARKRLNEVAHPLIMQRLEKAMSQTEGAFVFAEVPLLFEGGYEQCFDGVIIVMRDEKERIIALKQRDGTTEDYIRQQMLSQFDYSAPSSKGRIKNCNALFLLNNGTQEDLKKSIQKLLDHLR